MDEPPPPPPKHTMVKDDDLTQISLKKVEECDKHYVSHLEMVQKLESEQNDWTFSSYQNKATGEEIFGDETEVQTQCKRFAELIERSEHVIVFTGAGISTASGIRDFRSTVQCGIGKRDVSFIKAYPNLTHMALVALIRGGKVHHLISQNTDGLHVKSGVPEENFSELHGNCNIEYCGKCGKYFYRSFFVKREVLNVHQKDSGRKCDIEGCGGRLLKTTIDIGQKMPKGPLESAWDNVSKCDLMIVLGSSLEVDPAALMPNSVLHNKDKLVIVNLQKTKYSDNATMHIFAKCDTVMEKICDHLSVDIDEWRIRRRVDVGYKKKKLKIQSFLLNSTVLCDYSIRNIVVRDENDTSIFSTVFGAKRNPYVFDFSRKRSFKKVFISIIWNSNYGETNVVLEYDMKKENSFLLTFNPFKRSWDVKLISNES